MHSIVLLTRLQIMQAIGGFRASLEKKLKLSSTISLIGTAIICLLVVGFAAWLGSAAYTVLSLAGVEQTFFDLIFLGAGVFTFMFSLPTVLGSFFGTSDINDLLPLPVSETSIVFSKAVSALISSYMWTGLFLVGPLLGWGIASGAGAVYWVAYLFAILLTPMMPVSYAGILSILIAKVFKFARRKDTITTIATVISLGLTLAVYILYNSAQSTGFATALNEMSGLMGGAVMAFPSYGYAVYALQHGDALSILLFALLSLVAFAVFVLVARAVYLRIVTSLSSGGARTAAQADVSTAKSSSTFKSLVMVEVRKVVRTSTILLTYVVYPIVFTPIILIFLIRTGSLEESLRNLASVGSIDALAGGFILVLLSFLIAVDAASNKLSATAISREGSNWIHMKYLPIPLKTQLRAKMLVGYAANILIVLVLMVPAAVYLVSVIGMSPMMFVCAIVLMLGACWTMSCVGILSDTRSPNVDWGCDGDVNAKNIGGNGGSIRGLLVGIVYSLLPLLVTPLVGLDPFVFMPVIAVVGVAVSIVLGELFLRSAVRHLEAYE